MAALALACAAMASPSVAARSFEPSPYMQFVRARAADADGRANAAADQYGAALAAAPTDVLIATRAYRQAIFAGDEKLALRSAVALDSAGNLPPDGRLFLLVEQVKVKNWAVARTTITKIEREQAFGFLVPILRSWVAFGSGTGAPLSELGKTADVGLGAVYSAEHRALISLAMGRRADAVAILKAGALGQQWRDLSLRLLVARSLAANGDRAGAAALVQDDDPVFASMRKALASKKKIADLQIDAAYGLGQLFLRVAIDINREKVAPLSVALSRIATFAAPENPTAWLTAAQFLILSERYNEALEALTHIPATDPFSEPARAMEIRTQLSSGSKEKALAEITAITNAPGADASDWTLQGDVYNSLDRYVDAASAYSKAIDLISAGSKKDDRLWSLWLLKGSALDQAGNWPEAKAALKQAAVLGPDQAVVLNYLGYAQLERRENMVEARALVEQASSLKPDDPAITDSLGWAHYLAGDYETAIAKLETAVAGDPGGAEINEHLGDAYWSAGRRIEARYAWRAALVTADEKVSPRLTRKIDFGLDTGDAAP